MEYWKMNLEVMQKTNDVKDTALCLNDKTKSKDLPCMDRIGIPVMPQTVFGGQECFNKDEKQTDCSLCKKRAKALSKNLI